jgi:hypothetical protein
MVGVGFVKNDYGKFDVEDDTTIRKKMSAIYQCC